MGTLYKTNAAKDSGYYTKKKKYEQEHNGGAQMTNAEFDAVGYVPQDSQTHGVSDSGTSVFDPVLCELMYAWYSADGDKIIDPFAGGSVRGIVAEKLNRRYTGVELRKEQVEANIEQGKALCSNQPKWICGDSCKIDELVKDSDFDFMLTCPPYADLEVYSDDPDDISNKPINEFLRLYETILHKTVDKLSDNRFAVIVIGDARGKDGYYYGLPEKTVEIMERCGARKYNEQILVTPVGSLPIRVGKQFRSGRKVGKTHQNVLVFCKGDWKKATERLGDVYIPDIGGDTL